MASRSYINDPNHWRDRAEEVRKLAEHMTDPESKSAVFCARKDPRIGQAANFPRPAALRLLPTRETPAQQHARWRRRILLRDGAPCDRAYVATGALHTFERTLQRRRGCAR